MVKGPKRWERGGVDRVPDFLEHWGRRPFAVVSVSSVAAVAALTLLWPWLALAGAPVALFVLLGAMDIAQDNHTIRRNFPVIGRLRYVLESIRPEMRQYFVESDQEETPFSREARSIIYQRAKSVLDSQPFGTRHNVYRDGYDWVAHSLEPHHPRKGSDRVLVGAGSAKNPYSASILNISAMSYGALSRNAIRALNLGAKQGGFYHNTGEGGVSPYHLEHGGDLVWQVGTGYFGCRNRDGSFDDRAFAEVASGATIRMIEVKLSQGAKPGHGGVLPGKKVSREIADIRGVPVGETVISPPQHTAFAGPTGLLEFIAKLREISGKPVGFKLCVGQPPELMALVRAIVETRVVPDFITVDGAEGGTGAAPLEFSNSVGMPLADGLTLVHNLLTGAGVRSQLRIISAGKIATGFHVLRHLALGADLCNSARGMMFAIGCIQALKCNTNSCPVGVATQDPRLGAGLVVGSKADRVANFHTKTVESALELVGVAGLDDPEQLRPHHIFRRVSPAEVRHLGQIYPSLEDGCLLAGSAPAEMQQLWAKASPKSFG